MYKGPLPFDKNLMKLKKGLDPALLHEGKGDWTLTVHRRHVAARASGCEDTPPVGPFLMGRIACASVMREAITALTADGCKAPGLDGTRLEELDNSEAWSLSRQLARSIAEPRSYRPGPDQKKLIPKEGKKGEFRELTIQRSEDRVVGKATALVLEPVVDSTFSPFSFGFRPGRHRLEAVGTALV
ncbi:MAG: Retron-type reverse transcriptase, partial [Phycisphaerales bacterium]|nr:Retron-type reverse transcriptase [Phycisphaerales bacterium]